MNQATDAAKHTHNNLWSPLARNLSPYVPGEQPKGDSVVKLNTNESPFGPSPKVAQHIHELLESEAYALRLYPDPESTTLVHTLAEYHAVTPDQVFVGNGSDEVLAHIFAAFFKKDRPLLYPDITYSFYEVYAQLYGVKAQKIPLRTDFSIHPDDYRLPCDGIIFANPNAPTGVLLGLDAVKRMLDEHPHATVVVDEAYIDYGGQSALALLDQYPNLVVTRTFSKSRALAGLRVGYAVGHPSMIEALNRVKNSFNSYPLDSLAQAGAVASVLDEPYFKSTCNQVVELRTELVQALVEFGFEVLPSSANFVLAKPPVAAKTVFEALKSKGIYVRYFEKPRIGDYLRITVGTNQHNQQLISELAALLS